MKTKVLHHVMLSSNPNADPDEADGWPYLAAQRWDVRQEPREGRTAWSLACHHSSARRVGPGTVGWIHRWAGHGLGELAAVMVFESWPQPFDEPRGVVFYARGRIRLLATPVPGDEIVSHPRWSGLAPYTERAARQFSSGQEVSDSDATVLASRLGDSDRGWVDRFGPEHFRLDECFTS